MKFLNDITERDLKLFVYEVKASQEEGLSSQGHDNGENEHVTGNKSSKYLVKLAQVFAEKIFIDIKQLEENK